MEGVWDQWWLSKNYLHQIDPDPRTAYRLVFKLELFAQMFPPSKSSTITPRVDENEVVAEQILGLHIQSSPPNLIS